MASSSPAIAPLRLLGRVLGALGRGMLRGGLDLTSEHLCASCDEPLGRRALLCRRCADSVLRVQPPSREHGPDRGEARSVSTLAYGYHGGALAEAIRRFKYGRRPDLGRPLSELLRQIPSLGPSGPWGLVTPVPLHPRRLASRGYNQAALLAAPLASWLGLRHAPELLSRTRDTPPQARLTGAERRRNLVGAFVAADRGRIVGRRILLIDDVTTTGATLEACRSALLNAGAERVDALVLTRSERMS